MITLSSLFISKIELISPTNYVLTHWSLIFIKKKNKRRSELIEISVILLQKILPADNISLELLITINVIIDQLDHKLQ